MKPHHQVSSVFRFSSRLVFICFFLFIRNRLYSGSPHNSHPQSLPEPHEVRAGSKTFYFDVERNDRGVYVRLTEVGEVHIQFTLC